MSLIQKNSQLVKGDNGLRMPFAEWLFRMAEAGLELPGRMLAIHAAVFDLTGNEQISRISGLSLSTIERWKKRLLKDGWVLVYQRVGGRGFGIKVVPAFHETPVTFTDLSARNPLRFDGGLLEKPPSQRGPFSDETPLTETPLSEETPLRETGVSKKVSPAPPSKNPLITKVEQEYRLVPPLSPQTEQHGAAFENGRLVLFNGTRAFWLEKFGGDAERLDLALIEAAVYVQPASMKPLEAQVGAQLARKVREKRDRDERYAKAVKANKGDTTEAETRSQRWGRMMREIEAEAEAKGVRK